MADNRYRPASPIGSRRYADPRASTGGMVFATSFDPRYSQQPRASIDTFPVGRSGSVYDTQPIKRRTYVDDNTPGATISRTEYAVRPRTNSYVPGESRRPLSTLVKNTSPSRNRPVVSNASRDGPLSPPLPSHTTRDDASRYLVPASTGRQHHQRHSSATRADLERLGVGRPAGRPKAEYHQSGGYNSKAYPASRPQIQDDQFSYTGPREQFARDMSARPPQRRDSYSRRERPVSIIELPTEYKPLASRRDAGPPPAAARQLDRLEKVDDRRLAVRPALDDELDRSSDIVRRRPSGRAPVVVQHRDEGYSSARDDYERGNRPRPRRERLEDDDPLLKPRPKEAERLLDRERDLPREYDRDRDHREKERERERELHRDRIRERERDRDRDSDRDRLRTYERGSRLPEDRKEERREERREVRSRDNSPERSGIGKGLAAAGLGGLAAAGLAGAAAKASRNAGEVSDQDSQRERRHRKHRHRDRPEDDQQDLPAEVYQGRDGTVEERGLNEDRRTGLKPDESETDNMDDGHQRRKHRRRKHRDRADSVREGEPDEPAAAATASFRPERQDDGLEPEGSSQRRRERAGSRDHESEMEELAIRAPGDAEDDRPRRVQLVEPVRDKEEVKPKGILKPPRAVPFPEDPNPTREGVAPLKDAGKDGVPPGARWTKISRVLVNPEALEKAHERFEERDDYVIVLRVVTREEIQKFAEKTKEIREAREREWQEELEKRKRRRGERPRDPDDYSSDDEDNFEQPKPLAIDQTAAVPGIDPRAFTAQRDVPNAMAGAIPVPDIKLETANYSNNV